MKMRTETFCIRVLMLLLTGIVITQTLGQPGLSSLLFTLTFPLTVCLWLATAVRKLDRCNVLVILILAASCVSVMVNALITGTWVSFSYLKKLVMFWSTILLFGSVEAYRPEKRDIRFLFRCNTVLVCFLTGMYAWQQEQMHLLNGMVTVYLTFRFTNPNLAAVFLSAVCMIEWLHGAAEKGWKRFVYLLLAGVVTYFVYKTRSRNAQLLLGFFLLTYLAVSLFPRWKPRLPGWMAALIAGTPFFFAVGYLRLVEMPAVQERFSFLVGEGKDLDSRLNIWRFALECFGKSPVFGAYSQISEGTGASQMHNTHLDILASYGAPVFWMTCILLARVLYGRRGMGRGRIHFLCQIGFAAMLLSGLGEAILFSGGMGIYLFAGMLLMLANHSFESGG